MKANDVTQGAGNRIRGAKLRESFVASPLTHLACEELQQLFNEVAPAGRAVPVVQDFVDFMNLVAKRRFEEFLALDRKVRNLRNVCASLAEQRDGAATEVTAVLAPAKQFSDELLPNGGLNLWLHGPVGRTARSLHLQAGDVAWWGREAGDDLAKPVLPGVHMDVDAIADEIERHNDRLGGILSSLDEATGHLESTLAGARKAGEACDQSYLQTKATLEVVFRLGSWAETVKKYGPPSLRKLNRTKKRKKKGVVTEQVLEDAVTVGNSLAESPVLPAQESDLQTEESPIAVQESDLQTGIRSPGVEESDLQTGTRSPSVEESDPQTGIRSPSVEESDLQTGTCSPGVCRDSSALPDRSRRKRRREFAVTSGGGGHGGRLFAVTDGVRGACRGCLSVTEGVCGPRRSGSEVTDTVRSPENRGGALQKGVTARIRRFFSRPFG